ncbi:hypothetical protein MVES1_001726 [Malassezia vespertilionis]|uniref:4a-hydroxytetrahydrobiopterin dehydratase n=1 Tax=Malassezia vespertilionis TaxID=2020962 RepID=A0A2N1JCS7_9BASI|nr:uncharacterized protein MVES1_001726 [Malassezia vespertilionis]PKI84322.1 hypothetical protein MVES_001625 [Malassezia vespertilionis]WFD06381.1 hypothetical protein MVES1_001726 [Malassezia vespertilionis]
MLLRLRSGWTLAPQPPADDRVQDTLPDALHKVYRFKNFRTAAAFVQQIGNESETQKHHPAILLEWGSVAVWWWSHALEGLHENDYIMAARTDKLAEHAEGYTP